VPKGGYVVDEKFPFVLIDKESEKLTIEHFSPSEILMITSDKKGGSVHHHVNGKLYKCLHLSLEEYEEIWYSYGFRFTERGNVVNLNQAKFYDESEKVLYFEENPTNSSPRALVSRINLDFLKQWKVEFNIKFSSELKKQSSGERLFNKRVLLGL
jgi:DNA-binding LytR/AlgR family response regulator